MVLSNQQKTDIAQIALNYMAEKGITAKQFSLLCKVGESYLSAIVNNSFEYSAGNETQVMIADKYFVQIAEVCDYSLKKTYWNHVVTPEFKEIIYILNQAKLEQGMRTLVVDSGSGKSYAINKFKQNNPAHTFVLTMHSLMSVHDLFYDLIYQLGINDKGNTSLKRSQIIIKLREIKKNGGYPIIIIDEAENMNASMMRMLKGLYGEGTEASGNLFQVSNQVSLGRTEEDIIDNIERIINQLIAREEATRRNIISKNKDALVDRVWRAYGTLESAHIITSNETIALLSAVRLGVDLGVVKNMDRRTVNELLILTQPAHLQKLEGNVLSSSERDIKRAELIREILK